MVIITQVSAAILRQPIQLVVCDNYITNQPYVLTPPPCTPRLIRISAKHDIGSYPLFY